MPRFFLKIKWTEWCKRSKLLINKENTTTWENKMSRNFFNSSKLLSMFKTVSKNYKKNQFRRKSRRSRRSIYCKYWRSVLIYWWSLTADRLLFAALDIPWQAPNHKFIQSFDHVVLQGHVANKKHHISITRVSMMATKLGRIIASLNGLLPIMLHDPLIIWPCEIWGSRTGGGAQMVAKRK